MLLDLTHPLNPEVPTWNGSCGFSWEIKKDYDKVFRVQKLEMHAGVGTHMDAPSHRFKDGMSIGDITLDNLVVPACVIDVSQKAHADYEVSVKDVELYESIYGMIPKGSLVIAYTGWDRYWLDRDKFRNVDPKTGQMHYPAISKEAAALILLRDAAGLAIDTISPDCLDLSFPVHQIMLGAGKYLIENIANCSKMPPKGARVYALPIRAEECSEAPMRIVAEF
jgi:kynurenine formamidase